MVSLVFYDGECGLCDYTVQFLLRVDTQKKFLFAPLQGQTAKKIFKEELDKYLGADSLILIENYQTENQKIYLWGKGAFRILWLLGGAWKLVGWISFLPAFLYDWGYRFIARNRHKLFKQACFLPTPEQKQRFLP